MLTQLLAASFIPVSFMACPKFSETFYHGRHIILIDNGAIRIFLRNLRGSSGREEEYASQGAKVVQEGFSATDCSAPSDADNDSLGKI